MTDLDGIAPDLRPDTTRSTKRGKSQGAKERLRRSNLSGAQRGGATVSARFRNAPITLPSLSIQKRDD